MKLKDSWEAYYDHTRRASDINRQLAFAGIALIWLFRIETEQGQKIPGILTFSLLMFVYAVTLDLLHYLLAGILWGTFSRYQEKRVVDGEEEFLAPRWINWPGNTFFILKFPLVIAGYYGLAGYLLRRLIG